MTDSELLAAQHRVIVNLGGCTCNLEWKHADDQPKCQTCRVIDAYIRHTPSGGTCSHGTPLGYDCTPCPRGVAQVLTA